MSDVPLAIDAGESVTAPGRPKVNENRGASECGAGARNKTLKDDSAPRQRGS